MEEPEMDEVIPTQDGQEQRMLNEGMVRYSPGSPFVTLSHPHTPNHPNLPSTPPLLTPFLPPLSSWMGTYAWRMPLSCLFFVPQCVVRHATSHSASLVGWPLGTPV